MERTKIRDNNRRKKIQIKVLNKNAGRKIRKCRRIIGT
jgi:hypothetical protein